MSELNPNSGLEKIDRQCIQTRRTEVTGSYKKREKALL